jgi:hypothetical protein
MLKAGTDNQFKENTGFLGLDIAPFIAPLRKIRAKLFLVL